MSVCSRANSELVLCNASGEAQKKLVILVRIAFTTTADGE